MILSAPDEEIWCGVLRLQFRVAGGRSLKDKRKVVHQLRDRLTTRHRVAFAEVGWLSDAQRGVVAIAVVGNDPRNLRGVLDQLIHSIQSWSAALIENSDITIQRPWDEMDDPFGYASDDV